MSIISSGAIFIGFNVAVSKFINKLVYENDIDQLQRNLGKAIDPNRKTSLKDRLLSLFSRKASKKTRKSKVMTLRVNLSYSINLLLLKNNHSRIVIIHYLSPYN